MNRGHRRGGVAWAALLGALVLAVGALAVPVASSGAAEVARVQLTQAIPSLPQGTAVAAAPSGQSVQLSVSLVGQDPAGLAAAVSAISDPSSPDYHHYLTSAQFAAAFGPSAGTVAQVSSVLRGEGLSVGQPLLGSVLLPVSGTVSAVEAAFGTTLASAQVPGESRALVNTSGTSIPASLDGRVNGVIGLDGLFREHDMLKAAPGPSVAAPAGSPANQTPSEGSNSSNSSNSAQQGNIERPAAATPAACANANATAAGHSGTYTSTQMANIFGLSTLFGQGRTGIGQTIGIVEFENYLGSDFTTFQNCYGLSNAIRNINVDGGPSGSPAGGGEAALDVETAAFNAPSASLEVYQAPNGNDADATDLFNQIAVDDSAQVVTTSWGNCEAAVGASDIAAENSIFTRMAMQGQTMIAASGDSGSEDCFPDSATNGPYATGLAIDDPGSQPTVLSVGASAISNSSAANQTVWNNCESQAFGQCAKLAVTENANYGASGGGYSDTWARSSWQPTASGADTDPCGSSSGCRSVPDLVYPGDPEAGAVVAYWDGRWTGFGGTSVDAPTTAGFLTDTNQGCNSRLGAAGRALYAADNSADYTSVTSGNNDFTDTNGGHFAAGSSYNAASGLGSPVDQNLVVALQGGDGCPSVSGLSPDTGPVTGGGAITISGGGLANAAVVSFGRAGNGAIVSRTSTSLTVIPPNAPYAMCVDVTVTNAQGVSATSSADHYGFGGDLNCGAGYRFVASDGGIFDYGSAGFYGSTGGTALNAPVVGMATTPSTSGYWLVASDGGIFAYGDAQFFGSMGGQPLNKPIVGIATTPDGDGYWEVASDGGIFAFGDAGFFGSMGGKPLNKPIVGIASTPDGHGYWEVASDGGIFAYGDAQFFGSMGGTHLNKPIVGIAADPSGGGYWEVASDGGIFAYGDATFYGSTGGLVLNQPVVGMSASSDGGGYWLVAADGGIFAYGDAPFYGSTGSLHLNAPIVGMSSA